MNMADTSSESSEDDKAVVVYSRDDHLQEDLDHFGEQGASDSMIEHDLHRNTPLDSAYNFNPFDVLPLKQHAQSDYGREILTKVPRLELIDDVHESHAVNPKPVNVAFVPDPHQETGQDQIKCICDNCILRGNTTRNASVLCFDCGSYLCPYCSMAHRNHNLLKQFDQENKQSIFQLLVADLMEELTKHETLREVKIHNKNSIPIRRKNDEKCFITSMVVVGGNIAVLADNNNSSLKIVDLLGCKLLRVIKFSEKPWGVAKFCNYESGIMSDSVIAITFPRAREITFLDLNMKNSAGNWAHKLFHECYDIEIFKQQYITLCYINDPGVRYYLYFLDMSGITGKVIKLYSDPGVPLSGQVVSFTVHEDAIFVSCMDKLDGVILCFDLNGQVLNKRLCKRPAGICMNQDKDIVITSFEVPENPFHSAFSNITVLDKDLKIRRSHSLGKAVYYLHCDKDQIYTCHCNLHINDDATCLDLLYILQVE